MLRTPQASAQLVNRGFVVAAAVIDAEDAAQNFRVAATLLAKHRDTRINRKD